jgi:hypothetical protein
MFGNVYFTMRRGRAMRILQSPMFSPPTLVEYFWYQIKGGIAGTKV